MKTVTVIQCKECSHFLKRDFWGDSCTFWSNGNGCIVDPEGYCYAAELVKVVNNEEQRKKQILGSFAV